MEIKELIDALNKGLGEGGIKLADLVDELAKKDDAGAAYGIFSTIKDRGHKDQAAKSTAKIKELEAQLKTATEELEQLKESGTDDNAEVKARDKKIAKLEATLEKFQANLREREQQAALAQFESRVYPQVAEAYRRVIRADFKDRIRLNEKGEIEFLDADGVAIKPDAGKTGLDVLAEEALTSTPDTWRLTNKPDGGGGTGGDGAGSPADRFAKAAKEGERLAKIPGPGSPDRAKALEGLFPGS